MVPNWKNIAQKLSGSLVRIAGLVLIGLVFFLGIRSERTGFVREVIDPGFRKLSDPVLSAFRDKPPPVASIQLLVDSVALDSLLILNEQALQERRVVHEGKAAFAGELRIGERSVPVVIALREGSALPGEMKRWPLHVRALPGNTVLGMQTFDVIPVVDEAPLWTMLLHTVLMDQGNAALGSGIAEVDLNGKAMGLCVLHGRPDATELVHWARGSGPVLRFDDALLLDARSLMTQRLFPSTAPPQGDWLSAPLLMHSAEGDQASRRGQRAIRKLEAFRAGAAKAPDVFDAVQMARLIALCDLLGTQSAMDWWNLRFLVDSLTDRLVPIPLHITAHAPIASLFAEELVGAARSMPQGREITLRSLSDPTIHGLYIAFLDTFSTPGWWEAELARISPRIEPAQKVINAEHPWIDLDLSIIDHDRTVIQQSLHPKELALAYIRDAQDATDGIAIANVHSLALEVVSVVFSEGDTIQLDPPLRLAPRERDRPLHYELLPMALVRDQRVPKEVLVRIAPSLRPQGVRIGTWSTFGAN